MPVLVLVLAPAARKPPAVFVTTHTRDPDPADVAFALSSAKLADQWARALDR